MLTAITSHINPKITLSASDSDKPAYLTWYESALAPSTTINHKLDITNIFEYIYQIPPEFAPELPLSEISHKDGLWDTQRHKTELVGDIYGYEPEFQRYHERMEDCSSFLGYGFSADGMKLKNANFCRVRHCPVCQWRRSLLWKSNMYVAYEEIQNKFPTHRWLFLTLTVKNCDVSELRATLKHMNESWQRIIKRKAFSSVVDGWIRTTEVTRGDDEKGNAHPHFHVMLLVKPSFFSKGYIKHQAWRELWQDVLRVDYLPIVNIKTVKANKKKGQTKEDAVKSAIMETLKYSVKPDDMIGDGSKKSNDWFYELTRQTFKLRFIATGGVLKNALKRDDDITNDDMINTSGDDDGIDVDDRRLVFTYFKTKHRYLYNPTYNQ